MLEELGQRIRANRSRRLHPMQNMYYRYLLYTPEIEVFLCTYSYVVYWKRTLLTKYSTDTHRGSQVPAITQPEIYVLYIHSIFQEFPLE